MRENRHSVLAIPSYSEVVVLDDCAIANETGDSAECSMGTLLVVALLSTFGHSTQLETPAAEIE